MSQSAEIPAQQVLHSPVPARDETVPVPRPPSGEVDRPTHQQPQTGLDQGLAQHHQKRRPHRLGTNAIARRFCPKNSSPTETIPRPTKADRKNASVASAHRGRHPQQPSGARPRAPPPPCRIPGSRTPGSPKPPHRRSDTPATPPQTRPAARGAAFAAGTRPTSPAGTSCPPPNCFASHAPTSGPVRRSEPEKSAP